MKTSTERNAPRYAKTFLSSLTRDQLFHKSVLWTTTVFGDARYNGNTGHHKPKHPWFAAVVLELHLGEMLGRAVRQHVASWHEYKSDPSFRDEPPDES